MKLLIAYFRPEQLPAVKESLAKADIRRFTVMTVLGTAPKAEQEIVRGVERKISLFSRLRMEIAVKDSEVEKAVTAITDGAKESGGHGRVMVANLEDAITLWDGTRGEDAL